MTDIEFDVINREIVLAGNGDFSVTANPSVQNGGIILLSRCGIINSPMLGVGLEDVINAPTSKTAYELNRWQNQCVQDGATVAQYSIKAPKVITDISYL